MSFDRIAFALVALTASAIITYGLTLATSAIDYWIMGAGGAAALILLGLFLHTDNH